MTAASWLGCDLSAAFVVGDVVCLHFPEDDCCDMTGAIRLAKFLCPGVTQILTVSGAEPDTNYALRRDGEWVAKRRDM